MKIKIQSTSLNQTSNRPTWANISMTELYWEYLTPAAKDIKYIANSKTQNEYNFKIRRKLSQPGETTSTAYITYAFTIKIACSNILTVTTNSGVSPLQIAIKRGM